MILCAELIQLEGLVSARRLLFKRAIAAQFEQMVVVGDLRRRWVKEFFKLEVILSRDLGFVSVAEVLDVVRKL